MYNDDDDDDDDDNNNNNNDNNNNNNNNDDDDDDNYNNRIQMRNSRFFTILSLRRVRSSGPRRNRVQITCNTWSAYLVQHVTLRTRWYEGTAQLLSLAELKSHLLELYFTGSTINRRRWEGNRSTRGKPLATSFRKCLMLKPEDSSPKRDSNPHNSISGRLGKQTC